MGQGVTHSSQMAWEAHMVALWVCVVIGIIVFGAMAYAMFKFRHSKGAVPAVNFTHSTKLEIVWTLVPVILLVGMAWPATAKLIAMYDTRNAAMTVKVTGYQWMWKYEYLGEGVQFTSRLAKTSDALRQSGEVPKLLQSRPAQLPARSRPRARPAGRHQGPLRDHRRRRHPRLVGAVAGLEAGRDPGHHQRSLDRHQTPGIYRGQCAELCGKDHGFMPIVVKAVSKEEFKQWLAAEKAKSAPPKPAEAAATATDAMNATPEGIGPRQPAAPDASTTPTPEPAEPITH
jgi:cytochrome c oxidase subunit 2